MAAQLATVHPLTADPPVRRDGHCVRCQAERHPERSRKYGGPSAQLDPFCSAECCKAWYAQLERRACQRLRVALAA